MYKQLSPTKLIVSNSQEYYRMRTFWSKEPETIAFIMNFMEDGDTFYDIGACIGQYSLLAAYLYPKSKVYSFEPHINNYKRLIENIKLGLAIMPELDAKLKTLEGNGKPLWGRIIKSQQTKYLRMAGKDEITEGELKCLIINSPTSKYGMPAAFGEEYGNVSLADVSTMIKKARG